MKKNIKIIFSIIFVFMIIIIVTSNGVLWAYEYTFDAEWTSTGDTKVMDTTSNIMKSIITIIRVVGTGVSIIMLTYVAIKYMSAAPSEKAEFKKSAIAFVVGAIVLFATTNIVTLLAGFATRTIQKVS